MITSAAQSSEIVLPSAHRLISSLRSMGYEFEKAVADIIDNSIEAGATTVCVDVVFKGLDSYITILDDGRGMSADELVEAMRFGTNRDYEIGDLGKFGLGLKTASISQCSRLIVASRKSLKEPTVIKCWDLGYIAETNDWTLLTLSRDDLPKETIDLLETGTGTIVIWQKLDKTMEYNPPDSKYAQNGFGKLCEKLEQHLSMVFHRFLAGEAKRKIPFSIILNGKTLSPWDPFVRSERDTLAMPEEFLPLYVNDEETTIRFQPFILPHQKKFSSLAAHERASGPNKWNRQQGFYIYREDRMIQSGGWCHLRAPDEHTKLARIAIDFSSNSDAAFRLNVAKTSVALPAELREKIKQGISEAIKMAEQRYRSDGESLLSSRKPSQSRMSAARANLSRSAGSTATSSASRSTSTNGRGTLNRGNLVPTTQSSDQERQSEKDSVDALAHNRNITEEPGFSVNSSSSVALLDDSNIKSPQQALVTRISSLDKQELIDFISTVLQAVSEEIEAAKLYHIVEQTLDSL